LDIHLVNAPLVAVTDNGNDEVHENDITDKDHYDLDKPLNPNEIILIVA